MSEEPDPLTASNFVQVTARQTWSNLPLVIAGGLVFALTCVPAVVLGLFGYIPLMIVAASLLVSPAWASLVGLLLAVAAERSASLTHMPRTFVQLWMPGVRLSLLFAVPALVGWIVLPAFRHEQVSMLMWLALFSAMLGLAVAWSIGLYAYPMLVEHELSAVDAVRNGVILASHHIVNTVGMVGLAVLGMAATGWIGLPLLLFIPALYGMFVVNNYRLVMADEVDTA